MQRGGAEEVNIKESSKYIILASTITLWRASLARELHIICCYKLMRVPTSSLEALAFFWLQ